MSFEILKQAVIKSNINGDAEFIFNEAPSVADGVTQIFRLYVIYKHGNEYLRLDKLLDELRIIGRVQVFEFRGRGSQELPVLEVDLIVNDKVYQLIYELWSFD